MNGDITFTIDDYERNLDKLVSTMQEKSDAELVFVTTTFVPENEAGRHSEDAIKYNEVAKQIMKKYGVAVNDIYKKSKRIYRKYGKGDDDVHYNKEGYEGWASTLQNI